jgi:hypothetical protein
MKPVTHVIEAEQAFAIIKNLRGVSREIEDKAGEAPVRSDGWCVAPFDPNRLVQAARHVRLKPGFKLGTYVWSSHVGGHGATLVIPRDRDLPEPVAQHMGMELAAGYQPPGLLPRLPWAHQDIARFLEGDGSDLSYFETSILVREVHEIGAWWHGVSWGARHLVATPPAKWPRRNRASLTTLKPCKGGWTWVIHPSEFRPTVTRGARGTVLTFHTYSGLGREHITRHTDSFTGDSLHFETATSEIAQGEQGFVY